MANASWEMLCRSIKMPLPARDETRHHHEAQPTGSRFLRAANRDPLPQHTSSTKSSRLPKAWGLLASVFGAPMVAGWER